MELLQGTHLDLHAPIRPRPVGCPVPLSDIQLWYWNMLHKEEESSTERLRVAAVRVLGPLDVNILRDSVEVVVRRHESLRTRIVVGGEGIPRQHIDASCECHLDVIDLARVSPTRIETEAKRIAREFLGRKIKLSVDPLFAGVLLRLSNNEHALLLALEHMVGDAVSCAILNREIWATYNQFSQGLSPSLPQMPVQFADYAVWQERTYSARRDKDEGYWSGRMTGAPRIDIPTDAHAMESEPPTTATCNLPFGKALSNTLRDVAQREKTLLPIVVLTAYIAAMSHWCDRSDFALPFISHRRYRRAELQNMIGFLAWPLYFRIAVPKGDSLLDLLKRAHSEFLAATDHQDFIPLTAEKDYPQTSFNWGGMVTYSARWSLDQQRSAVNQLRIQPLGLEQEAPSTFYGHFSDTPAGVVATLRYRPDIIASTTIERLGHNLRLAAEGLVQRPRAPIGSMVFRTK